MNTNASATGAGAASAPSPAGGGGASDWFRTAAPTSNSSVGIPNTHNTRTAALPVQSPTAGNFFPSGATPAGGTGAAPTAVQTAAPRVGGTVAAQPTTAGIFFPQTAAAAPQVVGGGGGTVATQPPAPAAGISFQQTAAAAHSVGGTVTTQPPAPAAGISFQQNASAGGTVAAAPSVGGTITTQPHAPAQVGGGTIAAQPINFALGTSSPDSGKARSRSARSRNGTASRMTPSGGKDAMDLGDENSNVYKTSPFVPPYFQSPSTNHPFGSSMSSPRQPVVFGSSMSSPNVQRMVFEAASPAPCAHHTVAFLTNVRDLLEGGYPKHHRVRRVGDQIVEYETGNETKVDLRIFRPCPKEITASGLIDPKEFKIYAARDCKVAEQEVADALVVQHHKEVGDLGDIDDWNGSRANGRGPAVQFLQSILCGRGNAMYWWHEHPSICETIQNTDLAEAQARVAARAKALEDFLDSDLEASEASGTSNNGMRTMASVAKSNSKDWSKAMVESSKAVQEHARTEQERQKTEQERLKLETQKAMNERNVHDKLFELVGSATKRRRDDSPISSDQLHETPSATQRPGSDSAILSDQLREPHSATERLSSDHPPPSAPQNSATERLRSDFPHSPPSAPRTNKRARTGAN